MVLSKSQITNLLVFTGLLFTTARSIRETDNFYALALISFVGIWILNYKAFWDLKFKKVLLLFLPFGIWAVMTSIWSLEPMISFTRGLFYVFIASTTVLIGYIYKEKLKALFLIVAYLNGIFIILSFLSLISGIPSDSWTANHGMGFTSIFTHQNTLAAVLMFTLIGPTFYLLRTVIPERFNRESSGHAIPACLKPESKSRLVIPECFNRESLLLLLLILSNLFFIYLSYSRAVMLALFIGTLFFIFIGTRIKTKLIFTSLITILTLILYLFPGNWFMNYLNKGAPDLLARRMILWEPSYNAALNGGIFGLGYGVSDPTVESNYKKENKFGELKREKGNSILALIEETGIIGLSLFFIPIVFAIKALLSVFSKFRILKLALSEAEVSEFRERGLNTGSIQLPNFQASNLPISSSPRLVNFQSSQLPNFLLFSFILAFIFHAQFEGWLTGVTYSFFIVFLVFLSSSINLKKYKIF